MMGGGDPVYGLQVTLRGIPLNEGIILTFLREPFFMFYVYPWAPKYPK